jgi:hypothetical protein
MLLAACGGGSGTAGPGSTISPSSSAPVLTEDELAACDGTLRMAQGVAQLRSVRLRRGATGHLTSALDLITEGQRLVVDYAPGRMRTRVRTLGFAVTNLTIAVEDFRTTDRVDAAASNVKRRTTALRRAIDSFRTWVGCPGQAPSDGAADASGAPATGDPGASQGT